MLTRPVMSTPGLEGDGYVLDVGVPNVDSHDTANPAGA